jgi:hypothetical protein
MPQDSVIDSNDNVCVSDIGKAHPEISYIRSYLEDNDPSCELGIEIP